MKKLLLVSSLILTGILLLAGCSNNDPKPEDRLAAYTKLWNEKKFDQMYSYLSDDTKQKVSKKQFTERYTKIYKGVEAENLKVTYKKPKEPKDHGDKKNVSLPISVKMDTIAGQVSFEKSAKLVQQEKDDKTNWYLDWNASYIFPQLKDDEKVSVQTYPAVRGEIVDRNERGLAMNGTAGEVGIVPEQLKGKESIVLPQVASLLNMTTDEIKKKLNQPWVQPNYIVPIKKLPADQTALMTKLSGITSVSVQEINERVYPYKEATAHLIGYIGPVSAEDLKKLKGKGYTANDTIGKRGLEQILEDRLKGSAGAKVYIKGDNGQEKVIADHPAKEGETITLTIDAELQKSIYKQYKGETGSAAAIQPMTGEALALVSSPSFNPNKYVLGISGEEQKALENNPGKPLLNRFSSTYAPGSTIKAITASVALKNGVNSNKALDIKGLHWQKSNWKDHSITRVSDPGKPVNMTDALIYSDNIYFARQALDLGTKKFTSGLESFGFKDKLPFEYPITGSSYGSIDSEGRLADSGYGQGQVQMSSLHVALAYTAFLNQGNIVSPYLIEGKQPAQKFWKQNAASPKEAAQVLNMLKQVVNNPHGTAHAASKLKIPLAGKTGTAELKMSQGESGTENGWFVAMNTDHPKLLMAWMMEGLQNKGGSHHVVDKMEPVLKKYLKK
ncbi:penicillin-binding protein [Bacillus sp. OV322]|uniref:penicillin-binding transpeptidase domain-containing protein n=1 Tax=Bacillus sp. OV322 TaxID=1882764 RepID=UPI0008ECF909|nr:penicillin-binding transpeptidase domain-containing protein [Bacillus sp. OV322]SFC22861.1 penicillin-binding protein [Bacillus sp. OV322]